MPSFDLYQKLYGGRTQGQVRKDDSDMLMNATWWEDIDSRVGYLYDYAHDDEFFLEKNLHPDKSKTKIAVDVKIIQSTYNSLATDEQSHHIMFRPDYVSNVDYYESAFGKYGTAHFPIGLYVDIPDKTGLYQRWLIVDNYTEHSNQFPTYEVLPVDWKLQWICQNVKYECWGCLRSQSSYNQGTWRDYLTERQENQRKITLPMNDKTETLFYNQRLAISSFVNKREPVVWRVTKVEDATPIGIDKLTMAQDNYDQNNDYIERDNEGKIIGIWCDYFKADIPPTEPDTPHPTVYSIITYSGNSANMRINGSTKKLTVKFYNDDGEIDYQPGIWKFMVDSNDVASLIEVTTSTDDTTLSDNQIKIKFVGDDSYISKNLVVSYESDNGVKSSVTLNLLGL